MKTDAQMKNYVMRRVYVMYCARAVCKPVPRVVVLGVLVLALIGSVSIVNVIANALHTDGLYGLGVFVMEAFTHTTFTVQVVSAAIVAMIGWFAFDTARHIQITSMPPAHIAPEIAR